MINVVAEARALAKKEAEKTTVFVPLSILQALLDRIEDLEAMVAEVQREDNVQSIKP